MCNYMDKFDAVYKFTFNWMKGLMQYIQLLYRYHSVGKKFL